MSVINKMLRDLDRRQVPMDTAARPASQHLRGTTSLLAPGAAATQRKPLMALLRHSAQWVLPLLIALAMLAGAALWWRQQSAALPVRVPATVLAPAPLSQAPASPATVAVLPAAVVAQPPLPALAKIAPPGVSKAPAAPLRAMPDGGANSGAPLQLRMSATASLARAAPTRAPSTPGPVAPASSAPPSAESASPAVHQAQAGREALAQAQALWTAGSHDAAVELLQQAITLAERSAGAPGAQALMASLARELGRMQLAEGRAAATLELLTRLEPSLAREADIWALRGNAAQRLGRHQDSLRAYTAALQLRPGEQRWMLGAAVSFAAMGQTANATEMVDKARALGPISKEVQAYLRQAGVAFTAP